MSNLRKLPAIALVLMFSLSTVPLIAQAGHSLSALEERAAPAASAQGTFAIVSSFDNGGTYSDYGWHLISGSPPIISSSTNYFGEPSLKLKAGASVENGNGVVQGGQFISFQFAAMSSSGMSSFSIVNSQGSELLTVGVQGARIYAGTAEGNLALAGFAPVSSAYPSGWVYVSGNVFNSSTKKSISWTTQLFVDGSSSYFYNLSTPAAYQYAGVELSGPSSSGQAGYLTDIVFSSYGIPAVIPGYNPMEGYGQGSGLLVSNLQPFTVLHGQMTLADWNVPEQNILSYQINAMNYYGATRSTCKGFFQLGVDINPGGYIAPWYVQGTNCIAHYFLPSNNPAAQAGFYSPPGTTLELNIIYSPANKTITFNIIDLSVSSSSGNRYWNATIPYSGTDFYASYTQLEFQPSSSFPISKYYFNGSMSGLSYGDSLSSLTPLNGSYMLPYTLNAPPSWSFTYYSAESAGYSQIA